MFTKRINIVTHDGTFHLDDVLSVALIRRLYGNRAKVIVTRTRDKDLLKQADWVIDVGKTYNHATKRYDHHQLQAPVRANGIPYSTLGLLWKHYGDELCSGNVLVSKAIDIEIIQVIDAHDNGIEAYQSLVEGGKVPALAMLTYLWMPNDGEDLEVDKQFEKLVAFGEIFLDRLIKSYLASDRDQKIVYEHYFKAKDRSIIELPYNIFINNPSEFPELYFTYYQSRAGHWKAKCLSQNFKCKVSFPLEWRGIDSEKLCEITGVHDAEFVHTAGFLAVAGSKESIILMCRKALIESGI